MQLLGVREVAARLDVSRPSVYRLIKEHGFPKPLRIGAGRSAWREDEVLAWIDVQSALRNA